MNSKERETYWRQILARLQQSELSVKAFCRQENICAHTLYMWRRRLKQSRAVKFALVKVKPELRTSGGLEVILPGGERLQMTGGVDAAALRTVLAVLRERA